MCNEENSDKCVACEKKTQCMKQNLFYTKKK